ncbi:helix-turn-helix transcriptional regulator [Blastococcus sp. SYSU D00695]
MTTVRAGAALEVSGPVDPARLRAWSAAYVGSGIADAVWIPEQLTAFRGRLRRRMVQDIALIDVESDPFGSRWTTGTAAAEHIGVSVKTRTFTERVVLGDNREFVSTTSMDVWDASILVEAEVLDPMAQTMLLVPKSALHMSPSCSLRRSAAVGADEPTLAVLRSLVLAVTANADRFDATSAAAARDAVVDLLLCVVRERRLPPGAAVGDAMRVAVCRWVEENLPLGNLTAEQAAEHHGISVRSLHRLFTESGDSFRSLVRRRRVAGAGRDLLRTDDLVQTIAMRWGYYDASQFINEFKRAHGSSPAAYRAAHRTVPRPPG